MEEVSEERLRVRGVVLGVQDVGVPGIIHLLRRHWLQAGAHQGQVFAVLLCKLCCLRGRVAVPLHQDGHHGGHIQRFDLLGRGVEPAHLLQRRLAPRLLALCVLSRALPLRQACDAGQAGVVQVSSVVPQVARPDLDVLDLAVGVHLENQDSHARVGHAVRNLDHEGTSVHRQEFSSRVGMLIALEEAHHLSLSLVYDRIPQDVLRHQGQACIGR
mmetsp:Transcript_15518/g.36609  ORF Transcript_15518/g.36609 Transcript_15518/m.36609 type:complete len:215 (-) Transcript_15518:1217-1861(-)